MRVVDLRAVATPYRHAPETANTAAVITVAAAAGEIHVLESLEWSTDGTPTNCRLTAVVDGNTIVDVYITAAGPGQLHFPRGRYFPGSVNKAMVITLSAAGAGVSGSLVAMVR